MIRYVWPVVLVALWMGAALPVHAQDEEKPADADVPSSESASQDEEDKFAGIREIMPDDLTGRPSRMSVSREEDGMAMVVDFDSVSFRVKRVGEVNHVSVSRTIDADDPILAEHFPTLAEGLSKLHKPMIDGEVKLQVEVTKSVELDDLAELEEAFPSFAPFLSRYTRLLDAGGGRAVPAVRIRAAAPPPPPPPGGGRDR